MTENIFITKSAPEDALVQQLHTITYIITPKEPKDASNPTNADKNGNVINDTKNPKRATPKGGKPSRNTTGKGRKRMSAKKKK